MVAEWIHTVQNLSDQQFWWSIAALAFFALILLYLFMRSLGRARLMEDTPTSRIRSAAQGFVELAGTGKLMPGTPVVAPLSGRSCLWWHYSIEKKVTHNRKTSWHTVEKRTSDDLFLLEDETGTCIVDPDDADVRPSKKLRWHGNSRWPERGPRTSPFGFLASYRYRELMILPGDELYTLGQFHTQRATAGHFDANAEVNALMREWKQDRQKLLQRFDVNKDGEVDLKEWEAARRVAMKRVREMILEENTNPGLHVLSKPANGKPFLLSTTDEDTLTRRFRLRGGVCLLLFLSSMGLCAWMLSIRGIA